MHWTVSDYLKDIEKYLGKKVDIVLINNESPSKEQIAAYKLQEGDGVLVPDDLKDKRALRAPLLSYSLIKFNKADKIKHVRSFIRHNSVKFAEALNKVIKAKL